jgi:hypothetical protein
MMSWIKYARIGDKVVCVKEIGPPRHDVAAIDELPAPVVGEIYTIRSIGYGVLQSPNEPPSIGLEEMGHGIYKVSWKGRPCLATNILYESTHFRPVDKTKRSMEKLRGLLTPTKELEIQ